MTNEEVAAILIREIDEDSFMRIEYREQIHEALNMAVKAISKNEEKEMAKWIPVNTMLPNEDEIYYDGVEIEEERKVSDRVLAVDETGWIRLGYFIKSCKKHQYNGKRIKNKYSDYGVASWEFGNNYEDKKENWIVCDANYTPVAWMPSPQPYKVESERKR